MGFELDPEALDIVRKGQAPLLKGRITTFETRDLIFGITECPNCWAARFFRRAGVDLVRLRDEVRRDVSDADVAPVARDADGAAQSAPRTTYSTRCSALLHAAADDKRSHDGDGTINSCDIVRELLFGVDYGSERNLLERHGFRRSRIGLAVRLMQVIPDVDAPGDEQAFQTFVEYGNLLSPMFSGSERDEVVGREDEVRWAAKNLGRADINSVVLVGEPGVGKTAVALRLAEHIENAPVGDPLQGKCVIGIDVAAMRIGVTYRDDFVSRLAKVLEVQRRSSGGIILFVGRIRDFLDANSGWTNPKGVTANIVPPLKDGSLQIIGTATQAEFDKLISGDPALRKHFAQIPVAAPDRVAAIEMLKAARPRREAQYEVKIDEEALRAAVELSEKLIPDRNLPEKAVDLMDEAAALKRRDGQSDSSPPVITAEDVEDLAEQRHGKLTRPDAGIEILNPGVLSDCIGRRVAGQNAAIEPMVRRICRELNQTRREQRPIGSFLLTGPSGVGKTEFAKTLAENLAAAGYTFFQSDMSEITSRADVSRLTGGSPNYVGYEEGGQLTNAVMKNPRCVILLDEIEKAHPAVFDLLLQVFDAGRLTDGKGNVVDFSQTIIIMTSNLGSSEVVDLGAFTAPSSAGERGLPLAYERAIKRTFRREFINRIDDIVVFQPLYREQLLVVIDNALTRLRSDRADQGISVELTDGVRDLLLELPRDPLDGARPLIRAFDDHVGNAVFDCVLDDDSGGERTIIVDADGGGLAAVAVPGNALAWTFQQAMSMTRAHSRLERRGSELRLTGGAIEHLAMLVRQVVDRDPPIQLEFCMLPDALSGRMVRHLFGDRGYVHLRRVLERHVEAAVEGFVESQPYLSRTDVVVDVEDGEVTVA